MLLIRPYQRAAVDALAAHLRNGRRPILVSPTGSGKSFMMTTLVSELSCRALFLVHRRELTAQLAGQCRAFGLDVGIIQAGAVERRDCLTQVASVQSLSRREHPEADLILVDEAHHSASATHRRILAAYPHAMIMGATATPARLDQKPLGDLFNELVIAATPRELCDDGTLVEPTVFVPDNPDLRAVRITAGEYNLKALAREIDKPKLIANIVQTWLRLGGGKTTVAFAVNIEHSRHIVARFVEAGVRAEHVDGSTPTMARAQAFSRLRSGGISVLSNVGLINEGFDLPALECAIIARPTASLTWHLQSIGRIARVAPDKLGALILDHAANHLRHGCMADDRQWSLTTQVAAKETAGTVPVKRCPACYMLVARGSAECPNCGHTFRAETGVPKEADGQLVRLQAARATPFPIKAAAWDVIESQRQAFGFKEGWSYYRYRSRFGESPLVVGGRLVDPAQAGGSVWREEYRRLAVIAREKSYKPGWVAWKFKARFGRWPKREEMAG